MKLLMLLLSLTSYLRCGECRNVAITSPHVTAPVTNLTDAPTNLTDSAKDMYVIQATVYQVGILTNRTDNMTDDFNSTGNLESVTLYHTNGTDVDLSAISEPFLTNVSAQTLVGVAPIPNNGDSSADGFGTLNKLTHPGASIDKKPTEGTKKRSVDNYTDYVLHLFKRDTAAGALARVVNGAALIPPEAGIQSISLPPLLFLNKNMTEIPVPIPNTSVVHYAKLNTLIQKT